jgi:hypothetical protein
MKRKRDMHQERLLLISCEGAARMSEASVVPVF